METELHVCNFQNPFSLCYLFFNIVVQCRFPLQVCDFSMVTQNRLLWIPKFYPFCMVTLEFLCGTLACKTGLKCTKNFIAPFPILLSNTKGTFLTFDVDVDDLLTFVLICPASCFPPHISFIRIRLIGSGKWLSPHNSQSFIDFGSVSRELVVSVSFKLLILKETSYLRLHKNLSTFSF